MMLDRSLGTCTATAAFVLIVLFNLLYYSSVSHHEVVAGTQSSPVPVVFGSPHKMSNGMCKEMFTISAAFEHSREKSDIEAVIQQVKENTQKEFAWAIEPYRKLGHFLPSMIRRYEPDFPISELLRKYSQNITEKRPDVKRLLERLQLGDEIEFDNETITHIKLNMLNNQKHSSYKLKLDGNRLEQLDGQLPFVPCRIKSKYSQGELKQCFRTATQDRENPYTIVFMGDSKARQLFDNFMTETRDLNYTIISKGRRRSLIDSFLNFDPEAEHVEAVPNEVPQLKLVQVYQRFYDMARQRTMANTALQQLIAWTTGAQVPPDVLVLSYGDWTFLSSRSSTHMTLTVLDSLDFSWTTHELVVHLLVQLSRTTRVLFLGRMKQWLHANIIRERMFAFKSMSEAAISWSYKLLMYHWKRLTVHQRNGTLPHDRMFSKKLVSSLHKISKYTRTILSSLHKKIATTNNYGRKFSHRYASTGRNAGEGPWFWDSTLPLTQATMDDCETLYRHDKETVSLLSKMQTLVPFRGVRYIIGMLIKMEVNSKIIAEIWKSLNKMDRDLAELIASNTDQKYSALFKASMYDNLDNATEATEYFSDFATTFAMPDLNCMDYNHPSMSTIQVEVSQLLNLACNRHVNLPHEYCCSS